MKCDYLSVKAWLKKSRKELKKRVISKSEFNRVRKIAGYTSFLNALEECLSHSDKSVDKAWCDKFYGLALNLIQSSDFNHQADVFFVLGFKDGLWDFRREFLPESLDWVAQEL